MQILSIDTSGQIFSIAILKQDAIELLEYPASKTNSEKILPEIVATRDNGFKAVRYEKLVALLIEAVKDQQSQIDELKAKL